MQIKFLAKKHTLTHVNVNTLQGQSIPKEAICYIHPGVAQSKDELSKQRVKINMRLLNQAGPPGPAVGPGANKLKEDKPTYKEKFLPPHVSMISYFMTKVGPATLQLLFCGEC